MLILHPAGRTLLGVNLSIPDNRVLGGLLVVAAVPLGWYAINELILQVTVADSHTELVHYGGMAVAAMFILGMGVLGTIRDRDRRFAAWAAGILAAYVGVSAIVYPTQTSSPGMVWGVLAIGWGVAFAATAEWSIAQQEAS